MLKNRNIEEKKNKLSIRKTKILKSTITFKYKKELMELKEKIKKRKKIKKEQFINEFKNI